MTPYLSAFVAFVTAFLLTPLFRWLYLCIGFTDNPGGRKNHKIPTPAVGGVAMAIALLVALLISPLKFHSYMGLFWGIVILVIVGAIDDILDISPKMRLLTQLIAAMFIIVFSGDILSNLGAIFSGATVALPLWFAYLLTVVVVVGYINAMNMLDGVDGLAGSLAFVQIIFMLLITINHGVTADLYFLLPAAAVLLAFLCFNAPLPFRRHALVFMGDAGSMMLGFILVWFSINASQIDPVIAKPEVFLWIAALPIFEIGYAVLRRLIKGQSPFKPDRSHLHHLLHDAGWGHFSIAVFEVLLGVLFGFIGYCGELNTLSSAVLFWAFVVVFMLYSIFMTYLVNHLGEIK